MRRIGVLLVVLGLFAGACGKEEAGAAKPAVGAKVIGVSLLTKTNVFFTDIEEGMRAETDKRGWRLVVQSAEKSATVQQRQIEDFVTQKVDAIVVTPCDSDMADLPGRGVILNPHEAASCCTAGGYFRIW